MESLIDKLNLTKKSWIKFQSNPENSKVRIRDAAQKLNFSEAELLSTQIDEKNTFYLDVNNLDLFLSELLVLDKIMILIRSDEIVHEKIVKIKDLALKKNQILINQDGVRVPLLDYDSSNNAFHLFYEQKSHRGKSLKSFQIFDEWGDSFIKIYLKGKSSEEFTKIGHKYKKKYNYELQKIDSQSILDDFNLVPVHFISSQGNCSEIDRQLLDENLLRQILIKLSESKIHVQIHVFGKNTIQYHLGLIKNVVDFGPWINIMDKEFNLHAIDPGIVRTDIVEWMLDDVRYCTVEFYNKDGMQLLSIVPLNKGVNDFDEIIESVIQ
tara:strand:- start:934 stop:1905 length:972 start_codon:yes stop_codon:yes gene_type:complete